MATFLVFTSCSVVEPSSLTKVVNNNITFSNYRIETLLIACRLCMPFLPAFLFGKQCTGSNDFPSPRQLDARSPASFTRHMVVRSQSTGSSLRITCLSLCASPRDPSGIVPPAKLTPASRRQSRLEARQVQLKRIYEVRTHALAEWYRLGSHGHTGTGSLLFERLSMSKAKSKAVRTGSR